MRTVSPAEMVSSIFYTPCLQGEFFSMPGKASHFRMVGAGLLVAGLAGFFVAISVPALMYSFSANSVSTQTVLSMLVGAMLGKVLGVLTGTGISILAYEPKRPTKG